MATIASKNPFDLLGDDGAETGQPPSTTKSASSAKPTSRTARSAAPPQDGPARAGNTRSRGDGGVGGNEAAYRDRNAGTDRNRARDTEPRGDYRGRGRGGRGGARGRGGRGGASSDDRHSKTGVSDHEKQVARGWGDSTGDGEWADEQAGEAIAKNDISEDLTEDLMSPAAAVSTEPVEEEIKTKTLDDFLAEQAEKRLQVSTGTSVRKANEGASKKLPTGKEYTREDETDFIAGSAGKKIRDRGKKERNVLELDGDAMRQTDRQANDRRGGRGGRGGSRGGDFEGGRGSRGSGGGRGRGDAEFRGRGRGGEFRGRGDANRGRGLPRGAPGNAPNVSDQSAFPTLGS